MADGRYLKIEKSPYFTNRLTDRHEIWHDGAYLPLRFNSSQNFEFIKSKTADSRHFENSHKLPYLDNGVTHCHEIWHDDAL